MSRQTILVTGAAGFIGSHAAEALAARGDRVVGIDNFCDFYPRSWKELNARAVAAAGATVENLDILDAPSLSRLIAALRPDAILHLAAMAGVRPSIQRPEHYARVNIEGTVNLLQAAVENTVSRFVFASSSSVYGNQARVPFSEDDPVAEPISPYAATKRAGELICHSYHHLHRLPVFCLRFFTVFGPRQRPDLAIQKFARLIDRNRPIPIFGDGSTSRDYTYIADIVSGILAAIDRCDRFRIYNLGGSDPVTLTRLVHELETALDKKAVIDRRPLQPGDVQRTCADLARSSAELGFRPTTPLPEGLRKFIAWYREHRHQYTLPGE